MIENVLTRIANKLDYRLEKKIDRARLKQLIARMRPMTTARPLIRLGGTEDGAYLVPDDLEGIVACFSPGVSTSSTFENEIYERYGIRSFLADWSVEAPTIDIPGSVFLKKYLGIDNDDQFITLDDWVRSSIGDTPGDLMLQMDIEGAEYKVLYRTPPALIERFRVIVLEVHGLNRWLEPSFFEFVEDSFGHILNRFTCVHVHANNYFGHFDYQGLEMPWGIEITFLRNDRVSDAHPATQFPHPLDIRNFSDRSETPIPRWWYDGSAADGQNDR